VKIAFAVSGIRPVYSVSDVPGLYLSSPTRPFLLFVANKALCEIDPWVTLA
jgi:hypothetical protein